MRRGWLIVLLVAGCGGSGAMLAPPSEGTVTLQLLPSTLPPGPLTLTSASLRFEQLMLLGDVQSNAGSLLRDVNVDVLAGPTSLTFSQLPQGVYSRLHLEVETLTATGSWNGTPVAIALALEDAASDLRAPAEELVPGQTLELAVDIDVGSWFAGADFANATVDDGTIRVDGYHSVAVAQSIANAIPASVSLNDR